jgi:hypothetical protein
MVALMTIFRLNESQDGDSSDSDSNNNHLSRATVSHSIINKGIIAGQKIAKISVFTLLGIGVAELIMGQLNILDFIPITITYYSSAEVLICRISAREFSLSYNKTGMEEDTIRTPVRRSCTSYNGDPLV